MVILFRPLLATNDNNYIHPCSTRISKGLKVTWGKKDQPVRFLDRWNPFSVKVPNTTFASHVLVRRKRVEDPRLILENAVPEIEKAIVDYWKQNGQIQQVREDLL